MVDKAFDDEEAFPKEQVGGVKRKVVDSTQGMRHLCFLNRTQQTVKPYMWRLAQRRRLNAKRWLANLDMQVKNSTPFVGLAAFRFQENRDPWLDWRRWPWLSIGMDLGADGVAALFGAQYLFSLNVEGFPDPSHGANNDVVNAITQLGLKSLWLLGLVSWNLPWGPYEEEHRFNQLRECLTSFYQ
jgi:hypothetical protein